MRRSAAVVRKTLKFLTAPDWCGGSAAVAAVVCKALKFQDAAGLLRVSRETPIPPMRYAAPPELRRERMIRNLNRLSTKP
jgi:hypothetical protein